MLVKGSLYTGTDEGAINLIKFDDGRYGLFSLVLKGCETLQGQIPVSWLFKSTFYLFSTPEH